MPVPVSLLVTLTLTDPARCAGVVALMEVAEFRITFVAGVVPKVTDVIVGVKPVPVIVTAVPPDVVPNVGEIPVTVGVEIGVM